MGSQQTFKPTPSLITVPTNYPTDPTPGKIQILWNANSQKLYHRLSPYSDYNSSLFGALLGGNEPFYYTYPDENNKGLNALRKYDSRLFPIGSAPIDIVRVSKFIASGRGVLFLGKQFLLQTGNAFNETRLYNPTSPIVAAANTLTLGAIRPTRHIDLSGGLAGIATSLLGSIGSTIFGEPKINPPPGTIGGALPTATLKTGGKGLLRAGTAKRGGSHLQAAWVDAGATNRTFGSVISGLVTSLFANFIPENQDGKTVRSDEVAYGLMVNAGTTKFTYYDKNGSPIPFTQRWVGGASATRPDKQYPAKAGMLFTDANGKYILYQDKSNSQYIGRFNTGNVGYDITKNNSDLSKPVKYGDSHGINAGDPDTENAYGSDMMIQWGRHYTDPRNEYPTKQSTKKSADRLNDILKKSVTGIKAAGYEVTIPDDSTVFRGGTSTDNGYDRLMRTRKNQTAINYPLGMLKDYRDQYGVVDDTIGTKTMSKGLPAVGKADSINMLSVVSVGSGGGLNSSVKNKAGVETIKTWNPYSDDQIAFFFYDVVNKKYIPFRATVKGITPSNNATWEELSFIGRADKTFLYGGFTRTLSFSFHINISSIKEMGPTYQRINYLCSLIKPANYTSAVYNDITTRFMVPPMVLLTIGDLYKSQPILIQTVSPTIPDDASWETQNDHNSNDWSYLASYIKSANVLYGQLPRSLDVTVTGMLLEKERAIVGGADFGNAPRSTGLNENWGSFNTDYGTPSKLHESFVVDVTNK